MLLIQILLLDKARSRPKPTFVEAFAGFFLCDVFKNLVSGLLGRVYIAVGQWQLILDVTAWLQRQHVHNERSFCRIVMHFLPTTRSPGDLVYFVAGASSSL